MFTTFLILKYHGISTSAVKKYNTSKIEDAINLLMSIYSDGEFLPEKYTLVYPFFNHEWEISESKNYTNRVANNLRSTIAWRGVVEFDERAKDGPFIFLLPYYINNIKKECKIINPNNRIDIRLLSAWIFREHDIGPLMNSLDLTIKLTKIFKELFNISEIEERELFHYNGPLLDFSLTKTPMSLFRSLLPPVPRTSNISKTIQRSFFIEPSRLESLATKVTGNPDVNYIINLLNKHKQVILYGPPGTGKTFITKTISQNVFKDYTTFIQFHPAYGYEEFIGGIRPSEVDTISFERKPGLFLEIIKEARDHPSTNYLLIIDEINRGNISKIFGEAISCLDRDSLPAILSFDPRIKLKIPDNLYILGTMNSTDRSIALVDYALRRRFYFIYLSPDASILASVIDDSDLNGISLVNFFHKINDRISNSVLGKEFQIGHTYFMPPFLKSSNEKYKWSLTDFNSVFNNSILPLLEEYCYGNENLLREIVGNDLSNRLIGEHFTDAVKIFLSN
jgi:5-methylcytosine-specific restriction protein B